MKATLLAVILVVLFLPARYVSAGNIRLSSKNVGKLAIVVSAEAPDSELYAARELQRFLGEITDLVVPIQTDAFALPEQAILLGDNRWTKALVPDLDISELGREGYVLKTIGERLVIAGGKPRGTLFGVYGLLEDHLGCRWFTPDCSRIPKDRNLALPSLDEKTIPELEYREPFYTEGFDGTWMLRNRMNSSRARDTENKGGKVVFSKHFCHTFYELVPPDKYFDEHPEYFSMIAGERRVQGGQLCLTNPEVVKIATKKLLRWIEEEPEADIFSVSQNDWQGPCQCPDCQDIDNEQGTHAGSLIRFVNAVAKVVEKEHPEVLIETLAYQYTRKPPKDVAPRSNVVVRLCTIECCFGHPLATDDFPHNQSFREDIIGWGKLTQRLYIWDYVTNFGHYVMPFPNFEVLKPNIQFFVNNGVKGIFEEGNYSPGGHGELAALRTYVMAKLLWDPDYDAMVAIQEFLDNYYGKASSAIGEYIELIHDRFHETGNHLTIYMPPNQPYMDEETMQKARGLMAKAKKAVRRDPVLLRRVQDAELPVLYVQIESQRNEKPRYTVEGGTFGPEIVEGRDQIQKFTQAALALGMTHISEGRLMKPYLDGLQSMKKVRTPIFESTTGSSTIQVTSGLGGRLLSWNIEPLDWDAFAKGAHANSDYPQDWGYSESYSLSGSGGFEDYSVDEELEGFKTTCFPSGMGDVLVERDFLPAGDKPMITIRTRLANRSGSEVSAPIFFKSDSSWNVGKPDDVLVCFPDADEPKSFTLKALEDIGSWEGTTKDWGETMVIWNGKDRRGISLGFPVTTEKIRLLPEERNGTVRIRTSAPFVRLQPNGERFFVTQMAAIDLEPKEIGREIDVSSLPQKDRVALTSEAFRLFEPGSRSKIVFDESSETGVCAWMPGGIRDWAVQADVPYKELDPNKSYRMSARIKVEKTGDAGPAFAIGIYDAAHGRVAAQVLKNVSDLEDGWQTIEIGTLQPAEGLYFWAAPEANGGNVKSVLVESFRMDGVNQ